MDEVYLIDSEMNPLVYRHRSFVWPRFAAEAFVGCMGSMGYVAREVLDRDAWRITWRDGRWAVEPKD